MDSFKKYVEIYTVEIPDYVRFSRKSIGLALEDYNINVELAEEVNQCRTFLLPEIQYLKRTMGFEEISVTGKKGTLIIVDTNGLHKAPPVIKKHRLVLVNKFEILDSADYSSLK